AGNIDRGEVTHAPCPEEGNDVPVDSPQVRQDSRALLGQPALAHDHAPLDGSLVTRAQLSDGHRGTAGRPLFGRVPTPGYLAEQGHGLLAGLVAGEVAMQTQFGPPA